MLNLPHKSGLCIKCGSAARAGSTLLPTACDVVFLYYLYCCRFVWCLFWFDVGYVLVCMVHKALQKPLERLAARRVAASAARSGSPNGSTVNEAEESGHVAIAVANSSQASSSNANPSGSQEYSVTTTLIGMAVLTLAFTVVSFAALMATYTSDKVCTVMWAVVYFLECWHNLMACCLDD